MTIAEWVEEANRWGGRGEPFFFLVDFEKRRPVLLPWRREALGEVFFQTPLGSTADPGAPGDAGAGEASSQGLRKDPLPRRRYREGFRTVQAHLRRGDTYLANLTYPTPVRGGSPPDLADLYCRSRAPFKLLYRDQFLLFSPERFVRMEGDQIRTHPMKGTIDASLPGAEQRIREDPKETYEHNTIVDLLRNDLSMVSRDVQVKRFRYVDRISRPEGDILQVSSEITGKLPPDWRSRIGTILDRLLPAGSVSGAPKAETCRIIAEAEGESRGYYTGIFGLFDGERVDTGVNIRYLERSPEGFQFRSGGGITLFSREKEEYEEMIQKVYVPLG